MSARHRIGRSLLGVSSLLGLWHGEAAARERGFAGASCAGCHRGGAEPAITITSSLDSVMPGETVRLTIAIEAKNGPRAGLFLDETTSAGSFRVPAGEPLILSTSGVTHSMPKSAVDGFVTYRVDWTAPKQPGAVTFTVSGLSTNGDRRSGGDGEGTAELSLAFGCEASKYLYDADQDGFGAAGGSARVFCEKPRYYAEVGGDCDDNEAAVHPEAAELCNTRDDDCDGMVDEGLMVQRLCEDRDGDGHGIGTGQAPMGCLPRAGFGACDNDCDDEDALVFPGAAEICNEQDDDCNGRIDENARMACGVGWCRRFSASCASTSCEPGDPMAETCNAFDDNCDGTIDNGDDLCDMDERCVDGECVRTRGEARVDAGLSPMTRPDAGRQTPGQRADAGTKPMPDAGAAPPDDDEEMPRASGNGEDRGCGVGAAHASRTADERLAGFLLLAGGLVLRRVRRARSEDRSHPGG